MSSHSVSDGGDVSDEVRSNQITVTPQSISIGHGRSGPPSGASSEQEFLRHSRPLSQEVEDGGRAGHGGRSGVEMSPLPEVRNEQLAVRYGAMEGAVHVLGAGPGGVGAGRVGYEQRGGAGNMLRRAPGEHEEHGDQVPLVRQQRQNQQQGQGARGLAVVRFKRNRTFICLCSGGSSLLLVAIILLSLSIVMFTNEKEEPFLLYTTANESNPVYKHEWLMSSVCMIEDRPDNEQLDWVLHTGSCNQVDATPRHFNISGQADPSISTATGYFLFLVTGSSVTVSMDPGNAGTAHYLFSTDANEASNMDKDCGNGKDIPVSVFENTGYYYICIIPKERLSFEIDVHELYYTRPITNECNNTEYHGSEKHKCCKIGFSDAFANLNCVYLTTRNQQPNVAHMSRPHQVRVYLKYNDAVKALTVVVVVIMFMAGTLLLGLSVYYAWIRRNRRPQRLRP